MRRALARPRLWLAWILVVQTLLGSAAIVVQPLWSGHERDFYAIIHTLVSTGQLPTGEGMTELEAASRQITQPAFYFYLAAPALGLTRSDAPVPPGQQPAALCIGGEDNRARIDYPITAAYQFPPTDEALSGMAVRAVSLLCGLAATVFTYLTACRLSPRWLWIAVGAAALIAFEPWTLRLSTTISNDAPVMALAAINLFAAISLLQTRRWLYALGMLVCAVLAVLTRLPGWAVAGFNALILAWLLLESVVLTLRRRGGTRALLAPLAIVLIAAAAITVIFAFNASRTGSVFGRYSTTASGLLTPFERPGESLLATAATLRNTAFELGSPLQSVLPDRLAGVQLILITAGLLAALVALVTVVPRRWRPVDFSAQALAAVWLSFLTGAGLVLYRNIATVLAGGGVTGYNDAAIFAPIRYYAPALPAAAVLIAFGLAWLALIILRRSRTGRWLSIGLMTALPAFFVAVNVLTIVQMAADRAPLPSYTPEQFAALEGVSPIQDDTRDLPLPRIVGYRAAPDAAQGQTALTIYAQVDDPQTLNSLLDVRFGADACQFLPGRGFTSTLTWEPGRIYAVSATIPTCTPFDDVGRLRVRWRGADLTGTIQAASTVVALGDVQGPMQAASSCPQTLGFIADTYRIVRLNSPPEVARGENFQPSINWIIEQAQPGVTYRTFTFTHRETGTAYTCDYMDRYMPDFDTGEYATFDRCPYVFPADAPTGVYDISISATLADGVTPLPASDASRQPIPDGRVPVGSVTVR